jgi:hypothetical protein
MTGLYIDIDEYVIPSEDIVTDISIEELLRADYIFFESKMNYCDEDARIKC